MRILNYLHSVVWFLPVRLLLSFIYFLLTETRNKFYDWGIFSVQKVKVPVLSVGNISVGGSGKTILTQTLIQYFQDHNLSPAVLSRGYGRDTKGLLLVADKTSLKSNVRSSGDEPFLIALNYPGVPVVVSEDRVIGAKYLMDSFHPDVIILDDGFQHRRLHRDLDLLLFDRQQNIVSHLLPWGNLRESQKNLHRADLILNSKQGLQGDVNYDFVIELADGIITTNGDFISLDDVGSEFGLFAGLGNNESFFHAVEKVLGPAVIKLSFPDHAQYTRDQRKEIIDPGSKLWITTQKDFIKLSPDFCVEHNIYYIPARAMAPPALTTLLKEHFKL